MRFALVRDITDRKRAEEALRRVRKAFGASWKTRRRLSLCRAGLLPVPESRGPQVVWGHLGFRAPQPAGLRARPPGFSRLCDPGDPAGRETGSPHTPVGAEVSQARRTVLDIEGSVVPFIYKGEKGGLVFVRDVSERTRAEEELRAKEYLLSESQSIARVGSWEATLQSGATTWTPEAFRLFGVSRILLSRPRRRS